MLKEMVRGVEYEWKMGSELGDDKKSSKNINGFLCTS